MFHQGSILSSAAPQAKAARLKGFNDFLFKSSVLFRFPQSDQKSDGLFPRIPATKDTLFWK
jgi:TPR repeat protein